MDELSQISDKELAERWFGLPKSIREQVPKHEEIEEMCIRIMKI